LIVARIERAVELAAARADQLLEPLERWPELRRVVGRLDEQHRELVPVDRSGGQLLAHDAITISHSTG
jgi:hypothetical protein